MLPLDHSAISAVSARADYHHGATIARVALRVGAPERHCAQKYLHRATHVRIDAQLDRRDTQFCQE